MNNPSFYRNIRFTVILTLVAVWVAGCSARQSSPLSSTSLPSEAQNLTDTPTLVYATNTPLPPTSTPLPPSPTNDPLHGIPIFTSIVLRTENTSDGQVIYQDFHFKDLDGDVNFLYIQLVSTTAEEVQVSGGSVNVPASAQKTGGQTQGTWYCGKETYDVTLRVSLVDLRGNRSVPQVYTMRCGQNEQDQVTLLPGVTPAANEPTITPPRCANGSPTNTWTLIITNHSNQTKTIKVDGKTYTVLAAGQIELYLSLNDEHAVVIGTNTFNFSNGLSCGENTFNIP